MDAVNAGGAGFHFDFPMVLSSRFTDLSSDVAGLENNGREGLDDEQIDLLAVGAQKRTTQLIKPIQGTAFGSDPLPNLMTLLRVGVA